MLNLQIIYIFQRMETVICLILAAAAMVWAIVVTLRHMSAQRTFQAQISQLEIDRAVAAERLAEAVRNAETARADAARRMDELRRDHQQQLLHEREMMGERFKALAADILQSSTRQLDERSRASIEAALSPMKTSLEEFTKGYRECYDIENRDRISMREEIRTLHDLNMRVGNETRSLANALKGNTGVQGRWGEMVLASILERSGLQQDRWFTTQESTTDADGSRLRPDAVIHCPKDRDIIIDSKVSITHYLGSLDTADPQQRESLLAEHLRSVENHVKSLQNKEYQKKIGAKNGNFVFMFMPHEGAYIEAMRRRPGLWETAFENNVIIVSPTHLVTAVRLVEQMWTIEDQSANAQKIADTAQTMIDSVQAFLADMSAVDKSLDSARKSYDSALKRLTSGNNNVLRVAERLQRLGINPKKPLPVASDNPELP